MNGVLLFDYSCNEDLMIAVVASFHSVRRLPNSLIEEKLPEVLLIHLPNKKVYWGTCC